MSYSTPEAVKKGLNTELFKMLGEDPGNIFNNNPVFHYVPSAQKTENYLFIGNFWDITEWTTTPTWSSFYYKDYMYSLENKDWITGQTSIKKSDLYNGIPGLTADMKLQLQSAVKKFAMFPYKLIQTLVEANGNAFDGTAFFSNTRTNIQGTTAIDNIYTGTGITLATVYADMKGAQTLMLSMVDKNSDPFNLSTDFIAMIPKSLFHIFRTLKVSDTLYLSGTQSNDLKETFDFVINPFLDDNDWYLINKNAPVKPFVFQLQNAPEWNYDDLPNSNPYVNFFATCSGNAGYGNPMSIILVSNTDY